MQYNYQDFLLLKMFFELIHFMPFNASAILCFNTST